MTKNAELDLKGDGILSISDLGVVVSNFLRNSGRYAANFPRTFADGWLSYYGVHTPTRQDLVQLYTILTSKETYEGIAKRIATASKSAVHRAGDLFFDGLMERKDRFVERRAGLRQLRKKGYVVKGDEIYHPIGTRVNGHIVEKRDELVGKLMYDGRYNRAKIQWDHLHRVDIPLRNVGYVSVAPVDKV